MKPRPISTLHSSRWGVDGKTSTIRDQDHALILMLHIYGTMMSFFFHRMALYG